MKQRMVTKTFVLVFIRKRKEGENTEVGGIHILLFA